MIEMSHRASSRAGIANSPAANSQPLPSFGAGRRRAERVSAGNQPDQFSPSFSLSMFATLFITERSENSLAENCSRGFRSPFSMITPANHVICVAVLPFRFRLEIQEAYARHRSMIFSAGHGARHQGNHVIPVAK